MLVPLIDRLVVPCVDRTIVIDFDRNSLGFAIFRVSQQASKPYGFLRSKA